MKIALFAAFIFLFVISTCAQDVDVSRLYVESEQDTSYVVDYASRLIITGKKVSPAIISCGITEMKRSGMFKDIKYRLIPDNDGKYYLVLKPVYKGNPARFKITEISLEGFRTIGKEVFRNQLEKQEIKTGIPFAPSDVLAVQFLSN